MQLQQTLAYGNMPSVNNATCSFEQGVLSRLSENKARYKNKMINASCYCRELLRLLKLVNVPSGKSHLSLKETAPYVCNSYARLYNDKIPTLERYYVDMINDTLHIIRKGETAYLYNEEQIRDVLRFEPNIDVSYDGNAFYVCLIGLNNNISKQ